MEENAETDKYMYIITGQNSGENPNKNISVMLN
jgi:hypothetical protein